MSQLRELLRRTADRVADYRLNAGERPVAPTFDPSALHAALGGPLPEQSTQPSEVVERLATAVEPALTATVGPRYFGFVVGGSLDSATCADVLTTGWDQMAFTATSSPVAAAVEEIVGEWLKQALGLPGDATFGIVTGAQGGNNVALAAARHRVLANAGWDVEAQGLIGAPRIRVVANEERHATVDRALRLLGIGADAVEPVAADANGAIDSEALARALEDAPGSPTIVCLQAGNVNTGACDDVGAARDAAGEAAPGSTWTAPSGSGRPRANRKGTWSAASSGRTPGAWTVTSG